MKMEVYCRHRVDADNDTAKPERAGGSQEELQQETEKQTLPCKNATLGSTSHVKKGYRFLVEEVSKDNPTTARSRILQQAGCKGVRQAKHLFQQDQQQAQPHNAAVTGWERFLPHQQLQVLLVEDDDATRHIVGALLRNCSYEVTPASNGLLAWELLMDQTNRIDLVLTEVEMPCLSGIGLLGRIMNHQALKHIPVIMMSSHDSMNVVFKCLSKGAVDFLVKPVRKNELKNLWQHVWRRCHSSSGSRSGSASQTEKTTRPKDAMNLNDSGTHEESDKTSSELNVRGGSDNGSGTQNPWTKGTLEAESGHEVSKLLSSGFCTNVENSSLGSKHWEDKDLNVGTSAAAAMNVPHLDLMPSTHENSGTLPSVEDAHLTGRKVDACIFPRGIIHRAAMVGPIKEQDSNEGQAEASEEDDDDNLLEKHASNSPSSKEKLSDSSSPSPNSSNILLPSLKRPGEQEDLIGGKGGKGVIHSSASAFSRYHSRGNFTPSNRMDAANIQTAHIGFGSCMHAQEGGNGGSLTLSAIGTSREESMVFPTSDARPKGFLETNMEVECLAQVRSPAKDGTPSKEDTPLAPSLAAPGSFSTSKQAGIVHAVYSGAGPEVVESGKAKDYCISYKEDELVYSHTDSSHKYHHYSHHHHHHHHIQHHYYHMSEDKPLTRPKIPQPNDQTVTDIRDGAPRCGSSNMANGLEGNFDPSGSSNGYGSNVNGAMSVNGSATGSNNGSDGVQCAPAVLPIRGKDVNDPIDEDNGSPDINGVTGLNEKCSATREAALTKFRQKRKERCFEKKVRYQSRKRLAEQRPRVRGQFVKQIVYHPIVGE